MFFIRLFQGSSPTGLWKFCSFFWGAPSSLPSGFDSWTSSKFSNGGSLTYWTLVEMLLVLSPWTLVRILRVQGERSQAKGTNGASPFVTRGVSTHTVALPFTFKSIFRQKKKNYGNSNISPCKNIILKKSSKRKKRKSFSNSITHLKFQHTPKYHLWKIFV